MLNSGWEMPWLGLGVYKAADGKEVENAVTTALGAGYRSIDTAEFYENEKGVGRAVKNSGIPRQEIFLATKVWNSSQGFDSTLRAFDRSLAGLDTDYVDLYLIHWPVEDKFPDTWRALERIHAEGRARSIGVSNFKIHHIQELLKTAEIVPAVNQVEFHPRLYQAGLLEFCREKGIQIEAWSPLMRGGLFDNPLITGLAEKYGRTPAQVIIRWELELGVVTIPKSVHPERIIENADVFDFSITDEDIQIINALNRNMRVGPDPDDFDF